jgi:hypothetical protein
LGDRSCQQHYRWRFERGFRAISQTVLAAATDVVAHAASIGRFLNKREYTEKKVAGCHRARYAPQTGKFNRHAKACLISSSGFSKAFLMGLVVDWQSL